MHKFLICTGPDWYRPSLTSTRQIAYQFHAMGYKILWVNPIPFKSASINSSTKRSKNKKILNKLFTHLRIFSKSQQRFYVLVPFYIPSFSPKWEKVNHILIRIQVKLVAFLLGIKFRDTILWISGSFTLSSLLLLNFKTKIYQAADVISEFRTTDQGLLNLLRKNEAYLCQMADHILASSPNIQHKLEQLSGKTVHLLTHGVNFEHFNQKVPLFPAMEKIKRKGLPIAGYYGTLSDANDKKVFKTLAENGFSVVIIGKVLGDYSELAGQPNIYFTGPVDFQQLPSYAQAFDVCLLNWIMADWIRNSFPVKTLEYLAMGKPIISCHIPVVKQLFGHLVYFAETPTEFLEQAKIALTENAQEKAKARTTAASEHTWESKFSIIETIIR